LRWTDFDFKRSAVLIQRSSVGKQLNRLKTECSQDEVPLERGFIVELKKWQELCLESEGQWLFPSPVTGRPLHADSIRADYLIPTSLQLGLGRIGFHTFRHTHRAWLDETGAPVGVQQKLMRHAHISTPMDQYGDASMEAKRKANRPRVQRLLKRSAGNEPAFIQCGCYAVAAFHQKVVPDHSEQTCHAKVGGRASFPSAAHVRAGMAEQHDS
jgi:integrase